MIALIAAVLAAWVLLASAVVAAFYGVIGRTDPARDNLLIADMALNVGLAGQAGETVSRRLARLRRDGSPAGRRVGATLCAALTWIGNRLGAAGDHCTWALNSQGSFAHEFWHWSPPPKDDD